jgi:DNA-binding Lrp family transcriptional regulator
MQGVPLDNSSGAASHLRTLVAKGYLEETVFGTDQQALLQPTERAVAVTRSWPSAVSIAREVVKEVVAELEHRPEQEASTVRASLTASGRDLFVEVLAAAIAKQSGIS